MNIALAAVDESLATAWQQFCGDVAGVTIHRGSILDVPCDAVVSPVNSFGFMDGGIDALYLDYFGPDIQSGPKRASGTNYCTPTARAAYSIETLLPRTIRLRAARSVRVWGSAVTLHRGPKDDIRGRIMMVAGRCESRRDPRRHATTCRPWSPARCDGNDRERVDQYSE